ncbi:MAG TPA: YdeI/OmpD-associated family protein [Aliidongia sp.]|uniref:YdeI/OmpD-associated family protein n=1 Tax=Aliidongia sp. TaxID=1914230 RepID=UPI002DDD23D9|nr:YdeI/OmpD-associated family protein [Aliidongia sp.]HEV2675309.1 YdeI/OmpD-associated family protein [Aliidongia sp.]
MTGERRAGLPILGFATAPDWAAWLEVQPGSSDGLWLKLAKKGSGVASLSRDEAIDLALCHGWIDGQLDKYDECCWLVRFTPRKPRSKWSKINRTRAQALIADGRMRPSGQAEVDAAQADGRWDAAYASQGTATVPPDLQAALDAAPAAREFFATLDGANRYAILYRVQDAKTAATRARRIEQFIAMLGRGETIHPRKHAG